MNIQPFLLQFVDDGGYSLAAILLAAVLLTIGDDCHKDAVVIGYLFPDAVDTKADGIKKGSAGSRVVLVRTEIIDLPDGNLVSKEPDVVRLERNDADELLLIRIFFLRFAYCLQCLVQTVERLALDTTHAAALIQNNQIEYLCLHNKFLLKFNLLF